MRRPAPIGLAVVVAVALSGLGAEATASEDPEPAMTLDAAAERYVHLVLALGEHDEDYVDAYYGPPAWREDVRSATPSLEEIVTRAEALQRVLSGLAAPASEIDAQRRRYLSTQLGSLVARGRMLQGVELSFDEESRALYDAVAPRYPEQHFEAIIARLDELLPGRGAVGPRLKSFRSRFVVPEDQVDAVFRAAVAGCRERTVEHLELPADEAFEIEYVRDKSWSGYNWYQGGYRSLIQVNLDLPIFIDRAVDLACHEGYPGHHVYNLLLEKNLVRDRGFVELSVYPLFSPQSLIAEGSANYGIELAFPGAERIEFERRVLFPLAGLEAADAELYYRVLEALAGLGYAGNEAARGYLDGDIDAGQAARWLQRFALSTPQRAEQRIRFFDQYRSYVINYNLGLDIVRDWIEREAGDDPADRWQVFGRLLSSPLLPSDLNR